MDSRWYYSVNGKEVGPVSQQVLKQLASTGAFSQEDSVRREGMEIWVLAKAVKGLAFEQPQKKAPPSEPPLDGGTRPNSVRWSVSSRRLLLLWGTVSVAIVAIAVTAAIIGLSTNRAASYVAIKNKLEPAVDCLMKLTSDVAVVPTSYREYAQRVQELRFLCSKQLDSLTEEERVTAALPILLLEEGSKQHFVALGYWEIEVKHRPVAASGSSDQDVSKLWSKASAACNELNDCLKKPESFSVHKCRLCYGDEAIVCDACAGSHKCKNCEGSGKCRHCKGERTFLGSRCNTCDGTGKCARCKGSGDCKACGKTGKVVCPICDAVKKNLGK